MKIIKNLVATKETNDKKYIYYYRIVESIFEGIKSYGIEVERQDFKRDGGEVINIEKDIIDIISSEYSKVDYLVNVLYRNVVSPIHLIDVIGEYVDKYAYEF